MQRRSNATITLDSRIDFFDWNGVLTMLIASEMISAYLRARAEAFWSLREWFASRLANRRIDRGARRAYDDLGVLVLSAVTM